MTFYIDVPDMNDSMNRITLSGVEFFIRFTYNAHYDYWNFSLYNMDQELLLGMIRIVPLCPLTEYYIYKELPDGKFGCEAQDVNNVGRDAFKNGTAKFFYIPNSDLEGWEPYG